MGWLEVGVESVVLLPRAIPVRNPQEVIQLALMMVLVGFFVQADVMFEPVVVDQLQLVITSVLYLVGNLRHFSSYSVWSTPWLMQFPRLPFADGRVKVPFGNCTSDPCISRTRLV